MSPEQLHLHQLAGHEYVLVPGHGPRVMLVLHGTGGDEHDLLPLARAAAPDSTLLSVRGNVLEGGTVRRFFRRRSATDIDVADMHERVSDIAAFIAAARQSHGLDDAPIDALGLSNGANVALQLLLRHPGVLDAAVLLRPMLIDPPESVLHLDGVRVLFACGELDPFLPSADEQHVTRLLTGGGADVQVHVARGAGHGLVQADLNALAAWHAAA